MWRQQCHDDTNRSKRNEIKETSFSEDYFLGYIIKISLCYKF